MSLPLIVICGPTASGKSSLAIKVARHLGGEIVSADSMQIYKGFNIGTAKVTPKEQSMAVHHMIDIAEGDAAFSVVDYRTMARAKIDDCFARGVCPILCGGTGFYIDAVIYDMNFPEGENDPKIRQAITELYESQGAQALIDKLTEVDEASAQRIDHKNIKRIIRALEIYYQSGKPASENVISKDKYFYTDTRVLYMDTPREILYERINTRVDGMVAQGLIDEVRTLLNAGIPPSAQSMQAIGYKETVCYINGSTTYEEFLETLKRNTRRYAKRQITWFKAMKNKAVLDCSSKKTLDEYCIEALKLLDM